MELLGRERRERVADELREGLFVEARGERRDRAIGLDGPIPHARERAVEQLAPRETATASSWVLIEPKMLSAILGPMFERPMSCRNVARSSREANPYRRSASSRACVWTKIVTTPAPSGVTRPTRPRGASTS